MNSCKEKYRKEGGGRSRHNICNSGNLDLEMDPLKVKQLKEQLTQRVAWCQGHLKQKMEQDVVEGKKNDVKCKAELETAFEALDRCCGGLLTKQRKKLPPMLINWYHSHIQRKSSIPSNACNPIVYYHWRLQLYCYHCLTNYKIRLNQKGKLLTGNFPTIICHSIHDPK